MPDIVSDEDDEVNEANDEAEGRRRATTRAARPLCLREDEMVYATAKGLHKPTTRGPV